MRSEGWKMKLLARLFSWWGGGPDRPGAEEVRIVLYTREGCHLCDEAAKVLSQERRNWRFALESVNVDERADLVTQYGSCVPVVTVNGKVRFRGGVNRVLLRRLLKALATGSSSL
jgi:glutaredoxin